MRAWPDKETNSHKSLPAIDRADKAIQGYSEVLAKWMPHNYH